VRRKLINLESLWGFIVSGFFGIILWILQSHQTVSVYLFGFVLFCLLAAIWFTGIIYLNSTSEEQILKIHSCTPMRKAGLILLLYPNRLLFQDSCVTIHNREGRLETYIATGRVVTIQQDNLVQVELIDCEENVELEYFLKLDLSSLIIKPGISTKLLQNIK